MTKIIKIVTGAMVLIIIGFVIMACSSITLLLIDLGIVVDWSLILFCGAIIMLVGASSAMLALGYDEYKHR